MREVSARSFGYRGRPATSSLIEIWKEGEENEIHGVASRGPFVRLYRILEKVS